MPDPANDDPSMEAILHYIREQYAEDRLQEKSESRKARALPFRRVIARDLMPMFFSVKAKDAGRTRAVTSETAKEVFAKAVEWQVVDRLTDISISDGIKSYSIDEFASILARL